MINYSLIDIHRGIMHKVISKTAGNDSHAEYSDNLLALDDESKRLFRNRVGDAFGKIGKSLKLSINRAEPDSAYGLIKMLREDSNRDFIDHSKTLAEIFSRKTKQT